jgi:uncharacterized cupin superfamily protein
MWVLEGRVAMVDGEGHKTLVQPGQTFCLRNAIPISWRQDGFLRKFYMTYANPSPPAPEIESSEGAVVPALRQDAFFVPKGTVCSWNTSGYIKKYYSILDPVSG